MLLPTKFETYLKLNRNISGKTLRNYRADLLHFTNWGKTKLSSETIIVEDLESLLPHLTIELIETYKSEELGRSVPQSTINRRLSTLRNFGKFLLESGTTSINPLLTVTNLTQNLSWEKQVDGLLGDFERNLTKQGISRVTLKNYLSDMRQFFAWMSKNASGTVI